MDSKKFGLYVHIPFCKQKCYYCDFPSFAGQEACQEEYLDALLAEIREMGSRYADRCVDTIFFGGGTPSVLPGDALPRILKEIGRSFTVTADVEISAEANPGTVDAAKLVKWRASGINRISFGVQSFHNELLRAIGRIHTAEEAREAIGAARKVGFDNINLDLIYGLPSQTVEMLTHDIEEVIALGVQHLSVYGLIVEEDTALERMIDDGRAVLPSDEEEEAMYDYVTTRLEELGYHRYEISNYARGGRECRHNLKYWRFDDYLGLGSASHSFVGGRRFANERIPTDYIRRMRSEHNARITEDVETEEQLRGEYIFLALRTTVGVDTADFARTFGAEFWTLYGNIIERMCQEGLVEQEGQYVRLTKLGMKYGNRVFAHFV